MVEAVAHWLSERAALSWHDRGAPRRCLALRHSGQHWMSYAYAFRRPPQPGHMPHLVCPCSALGRNSAGSPNAEPAAMVSQRPRSAVEHSGAARLTWRCRRSRPCPPPPPCPTLWMATAHASRARADWACRRHEVSKQLQVYELGEKPVPVAGAVSAKLDGKTLTVTVNSGGRSISFNANVQLPTTGTALLPGRDRHRPPFPNNAELLARGVAIIDFPNNDIADQQNGSSRNKGKFFELHPCRRRARARWWPWAWG